MKLLPVALPVIRWTRLTIFLRRLFHRIHALTSATAWLSLLLLLTTPSLASFTDVTESVGIDDFERVERPLGVSDFVVRGGHPIVMDFDGNGWLDIYIVRWGLPDIVYLNNEGHFVRTDAPLGELDTANGGNGAAKTEAMVDAQIEHCTRKLFETRGKLGASDPDPIFIVGLPRAGSTLLEQILASHSMVDGTMELHNILGLAQRLRGRSAENESRYPRILWELDDSYFKRFGEKFIADTRAYREGAPFFIDKMPNNFLHIGLIHLILPNAKFIDARRDPMACGFSGYKQLFGEGQDFS